MSIPHDSRCTGLVVTDKVASFRKILIYPLFVLGVFMNKDR